MAATSATTANSAKIRTEGCCGNRRRALRLNAAVMQKSRDLFSIKTAHHLADITGYSVRACEAWLSEKVVIPADALAELIRSEWGREFLAAVMTDGTAKWWLRMLSWLKRISLEAAEAAQAIKYRELLDDEAKFSRAHPTTPMFQDDPFYEGQPSPVRALARRGRR